MNLFPLAEQTNAILMSSVLTKSLTVAVDVPHCVMFVSRPLTPTWLQFHPPDKITVSHKTSWASWFTLTPFLFSSLPLEARATLPRELNARGSYWVTLQLDLAREIWVIVWTERWWIWALGPPFPLINDHNIAWIAYVQNLFNKDDVFL